MDVIDGTHTLETASMALMMCAGHLGKLSLSLHWMNLGNQPVEVLVEDVYLLVVPSSESTYDPEEEERRAQAAKFERLENAELLHVRSRSEMSQGQHGYHQGTQEDILRAS